MNILIISFEIIREGECSISYSMASLLASLKLDTSKQLNITHWSFNVLEENYKSELYNKIKLNDLNIFDKIAISVFVWSEMIAKELLGNIGFYEGTIILGGRQIIGEENDLKREYPKCKIFIIGYGESCIHEAFLLDEEINDPKFFYGNCENLNIPSPYLVNELPVKYNQKMVRMETKRGCPYSCAFCAHRDLNNNKIYYFPFDRIKSELNFFKERRVEKINIMDPIFNIGNNYLQILEYIYKNKIDSQISLQVRFERIKNKNGLKFIDLCGKLNIILEFGVQSLIKKEYDIIKRGNDINTIGKVIGELIKNKINFEISVIYGLPEQTVETFQKTIELLNSFGCTNNIKAYPLMLLKGTYLYGGKQTWGLEEKNIEKNYNIPLVVKSKSFSAKEWYEMKYIADQLNNVSNK
jgi:radical SAM superfamily enzyme YgiQ (UPF0313 family)